MTRQYIVPPSLQKVLSWARRERKSKTGFTSSELVTEFKVSRQTAARWLTELVRIQALLKEGVTQKARYRVISPADLKKLRKTKPEHLKLKKSLKGLSEDRVFDEVNLKLGLRRQLSESVWNIANYTFSEILNNAIDHSNSRLVEVDVQIKNGEFAFTIRDRGYGIFKRIKDSFSLGSIEEAVEHLLKGKQTSAPAAHSGQGIFFTSKIGDRLSIRSESYELTFDNLKNDIHLSSTRPIHGTLVAFKVRKQTRRRLDDLFRQYTNEEFDFDRTKYPILILKQTGCISRSQARRWTAGMEKFDRIILNFERVNELGQGFADEIFRVFKNRHPNVVLEPIQMNKAVEFMVRRAIADAEKNS